MVKSAERAPGGLAGRPRHNLLSASVHRALQWTGFSSPQSKGAERNGAGTGSLSFVCHYVLHTRMSKMGAGDRKRATRVFLEAQSPTT